MVVACFGELHGAVAILGAVVTKLIRGGGIAEADIGGDAVFGVIDGGT